MGQTAKVDVQKLDKQERILRVLDMRRAGGSFRTIGKKLGVSHVQARDDLMEALESGGAAIAERAAEYRAIELERLDEWLLRLQPRLKSEKLDLQALDRALKIIDLQSRLMGLYVQKTDLTTNGKDITAVPQVVRFVWADDSDNSGFDEPA